MISTNNKAEKILGLVWTISILALFFHGKIPFMLPLSVVSTVYVSIYLLWLNKGNLPELKQDILLFTKLSWVYLLVGIIYILATIFTLNRDPLIFKESLYVFYIWVLVFELYVIIKKIPQFNFWNYFSRGYLFFLFILLFGFYFNLLTIGIWLGKIFGNATDYNYLALGLLMAVPIIVNEWAKAKGFWKNLLGSIFLLMVFIPILGSGSRRGLVLAVIVHLGLIIYLCRSFCRKEKSHILIHYFSILLVSFAAITILFGTAAPQVRNILVNTIFPNSEQKVKKQFSSISFRYSTLRNDSLSYKELYDKQWKSEPFQAKGSGSKFIKYRLNSKLIKFLRNKEYNRAWKTFIELRYFCENQSTFLNLIPTDYKNNIPESIFLSDSLISGPYFYPIPFLEKDFFDFSETQNIHLITSESNDSNQILSFETLKEGKIFLKSNFVFVPQTKNTISLDFKGIKANKLIFKFLDDENNEIVLKEKVTDSIMENGFTRRTIIFLAPFDFPRLGKIVISTNSSNTAVFEVGRNEYLRIPIKEEFRNKTESRLHKDMRAYLHESKNSDSIEQESLLEYLIKPSSYYLRFKNYGTYGQVILQSDTSYIVESPLEKNYARISSKIPSLPGMIYKINVTVVSQKTPQIYIKRYPEKKPFDLQFKEIQKTIVSLQDGKTHKISYQYSVKKSTSAYSLLIIGIKNASKFEQFTVLDVSMQLIGIEDNHEINKMQMAFLKLAIMTENNKSQKNFESKISKYISSKGERKKNIEDLQHKYIQELQRINDSQLDSIRQFINTKKDHPVKFNNYGTNSVLLYSILDTQHFEVPKDKLYAMAYSSIPAIAGTKVSFECIFNGKERPSIYSKRSPEKNPYTFDLVYDSVEISSLSDTSYLVKYEFQVKESNSGKGIIVLSYKNALKGERFSIVNARYKLTQINDTGLKVNSFQYNYLRPLIISRYNGEANSKMIFSNNELIQWRDSLGSDNKLLDSRLQRWKFSAFYFNKNNAIKKLFGDGFDYLKVFPIVFTESGTNTGPDYPHNPIISSFLYSGIFGGFIYIYFLGLSFYSYWRHRKELVLFGLLYSLAFAFTFFSGNSHFSVPAFTLLSLLPFAFPIKKEETNSLDKLKKQGLSSKT